MKRRNTRYNMRYILNKIFYNLQSTIITNYYDTHMICLLTMKILILYFI